MLDGFVLLGVDATLNNGCRIWEQNCLAQLQEKEMSFRASVLLSLEHLLRLKAKKSIFQFDLFSIVLIVLLFWLFIFLFLEEMRKPGEFKISSFWFLVFIKGMRRWGEYKNFLRNSRGGKLLLRPSASCKKVISGRYLDVFRLTVKA